MPIAVFNAPFASHRWQRAFAQAMPELNVQVWPEVSAATEVEYLLAWGPQDEAMRGLPGLRAVFSLGAGVDHLAGARIPAPLPVVRLIDPALTAGIVEYVVFNVLRFHRSMHHYEAQQRASTWRELRQVLPGERSVGILGLGELGRAVAAALLGLGFEVLGWSRSERVVEGVQCLHGAAGLDQVLARSELLVCLLPLTPDTAGILNEARLRQLPPGAFLINAGRGPLLVENDLLTVLDAGHLGGAALDVFCTEPLPADHPFWKRADVFATPHIASVTNPMSAAKAIAANMRREQRGEPMHGVVEWGRGY